MVAALVMALADVFHLPSVEIDMEGHGRRPWRSDIDVSRTLGWFTSMYPVAFHLGQTEYYPTLPLPLRHLAHVKQRLRSVPDSGFPYSLLKYVKGNSAAPLASRGNPQLPAGVVFNYAGRFEQLLVQDAFLTPAHLSAGWSHDLSLDEPLSHALSASGTYDARKGLGLSILFSTQLFDEAKVLAATSLWRSHLADLIRAAVATPSPCHTPSDFPLSGLSELAFSTLVTRTLPPMGLNLAAVEDIYPCLPIQEGLLLATLKYPAAYMVQLSYDIRGPLEQQRMRAAWEATFQHHAVFRTRFLLGVAGTVHPNLQVVTRRTEAQWTLGDWSSVDVVEAEAAFMRTQREEGFRPDQPLIRFGLFRTGPECHRLIISIHHAIFDGWSTGLFLQTFLRSYMGSEPLPTGQLHELVSHVQNQSPADAKRYWTAYFDGVDQPSLLTEPHHTADPTLPPTSANYYGRIDHVIESAGDLLRFGQTQSVTPSTLLRTAVALVLHRYTGSDNPVFGTVVSGRNVAVPQIEAMVGPCINTIPFCAHLAKDTTVKGLLQAVHARGTSVYNFEHCRLTDVHQWSGVSREHPLFNVLFVFENYPETQAGVDLPIELLPVDARDPTDVPLTLLAAVRGDSLGIRATFQTTSFSHAFVQRFLTHLANVLRNLSALPSDAPVYAVGMLSGDEEERLTNLWARNPVALPACSLAHNGFLARVQSDPDHNALQDGCRVYTYGQLLRMATRLAHRLRQTGGCGADQVVGILAGNSVELIVGQLAVWLTGSAFVVVAPDYPAERRRFILEDAACMAVVGTKGSLGDVPDGVAVSHVEIDPEALLCSDSTVDTPGVTIAPTSLAYIIYTSGTTGTPKGVMHEHRAVAQYLQGFIGAIGIAADDITPTLLTPTFDIATSETWLTLSVGGCLRIAQGDHKRALQQATRAAITPSLLSAFEPSDFPQLRSVILGGEPASQPLVDKWSSAVRLFNWFGPTELAHGSHLVELKPGESVSIGRPQPNAVGLILDDYLRPVPAGVTGQLYLGGFGTARCYLNRPELTAEKFIAWPATGERIYQSGDLARWLSDGRVECLGRIDNQVKVRGFRVELGEVESALEAHPAVTQACVLVQDTHLVGYVCPPLSDDGQSILDHIRARLPHHMVPSALLGLLEFPRTRVGKIDRKALPPYDFTAASAATDLSTLTPTERQLIQVTADCLRLEPCSVGLDATFYQVGGNSLTAILLSSRCQALGLNLNVADFNRQGTFRQLARRSRATAGVQTEVVPADSEPEGPPRLLPGQHAFFSLPLANPNHMVIPVLFKASRVFPETAWHDAVRQIVQRHPMLQAQFHMDGRAGAMTYTVGQQSLPTYFGFDYQRVPDWSTMLDRLPGLVQSLDYATGRLSTFHVFDLGPEQYFFYCVHHLASDYLSYKIFAADLTRLLLGQALQPPTATCWAWADQLYRATQNMDLTSLTLPPALPDLLEESAACCGPVGDGPGDVILHHLVDADMTRDIVDLATDRLGATMLELLVTTLYMAYRTVFALDTMGLAFVTHGRQPVGDVALDVSSTMGFFAHHVPVVITAHGRDGYLQTLRCAQQTLSTGIQDGLRLTLARYLRVFTDPAQQRPFQIDPPFLFSYLAQTQLTADGQGRQDLLQEQQNVVEVLRPYLVDLPFPFKVTVSHDSNRLKLTVMGRRSGGYSALVERLLVAWTDALRQTVAMAHDV
ncbi:hypothetical protein IWQ60_011966 [Tieghemiomyces parasiticus]|uniref:Carrier domain-containing protein n=1 Tax=Tieghemiomyces parasiticus TaxID=78921 RepID=A0A9W8DL21_9FUNG|nr:hypothetical protein IWQ60_011966 [Tieghemiomyces parasiticus]